MYIISTLVLIHYELELGLFTYFVTFYDISKQNSDFFHLIHFISWYKYSMVPFTCHLTIKSL